MSVALETLLQASGSSSSLALLVATAAAAMGLGIVLGRWQAGGALRPTAILSGFPSLSGLPAFSRSLDRAGAQDFDAVFQQDGSAHDGEGPAHQLAGSPPDGSGDGSLIRLAQERDVAEHRLRVALAGSRVTVCAQDTALRYIWADNAALAFGIQDVIGQTDSQLLPPAAAEEAERVKRDVLATGEERDAELLIAGPNRRKRWMRMHVAPERYGPGEITGVVCVYVDITQERERAEQLAAVTGQLAESNQRFDTAIAGSEIFVSQQNLDLRYTWAFNPPDGISAEDLLGHTDDEAFPEPAMRLVQPLKQRVIQSGIADRIEISLHLGDRPRWYNVHVEPLRQFGRIVGVTSVAIDVTEQREYQAQLKVVMRELTHRSKNLLAVVQGIARQTAQTADSLPTFIAKFGARLQALAQAHDILVDESWRGASLAELVAGQLDHVVERGDARISADGPPTMLKPEAAQNVVLALHELSSNAARFGALSVPDGHIDIWWHEVQGDDGPLFEIGWKEVGGPPVRSPPKRGFGRLMIERLVPRAVDGVSELDFTENGVNWTVRFPLRFLVERHR